MQELLWTYAPWVVLVGVFLALHWFGPGCAEHRRRGRRDETSPGDKGNDASSGRGGVHR